MTQQQLLMLPPDLQPEELLLLQVLTEKMSETQQQQFFLLYRGKRKDQQSLLILTILGFFGVAGIQRIVVGDTLTGIVYLLTCGLCGIGTIVDLVRIQKMTLKYNQQQAMETAGMVGLMK